MLFCRDFAFERDAPESFPDLPYRPPSADELIKTAMVLELYGMRDAAFGLLAAFSEVVEGRVPANRAANLLVLGWSQSAKSVLTRLWRRGLYTLTAARAQAPR